MTLNPEQPIQPEFPQSRIQLDLKSSASGNGAAPLIVAICCDYSVERSSHQKMNSGRHADVFASGH